MNTDSTSEVSEPNPFPRPEKKATLKLGQRELSLLSIGVVALVVLALLMGGYRAFRNFKSQRDIVLNQSNLHSLFTALQLYSADYEGKLPPADHWLDAIAGYISVPQGTPNGKEGLLQGPSDGEPVNYVYNDDAEGYNLEPKPAKEDRQRLIAPKYLPILIERIGVARNTHEKMAVPGSPSGDDAFAKSLQFPHYTNDPDNATTVVLFANGNIQRYIKRDFKK